MLELLPADGPPGVFTVIDKVIRRVDTLIADEYVGPGNQFIGRRLGYAAKTALVLFFPSPAHLTLSLKID